MTGAMFEPLPDFERASAPETDTAREPDNWRPILPVPEDVRRQWPSHKLGKPSASWPYRDAAGRLLGLAVRFDLPDDDKDVLPLTFCEGPDGRREWRWKAFPVPRLLYGLDRLADRPDAPGLVVEGEKAADAAAALFPDHVAVTSPSGSRAAHMADWTPLQGRHVAVWPDHDAQGVGYAEDVARLALKARAASVAVVEVPAAFPAKWDLADVPPDGWDANRLRELLEAAVPWPPSHEKRLRAVTITDFLSMYIAPREMVLAPVLPSQGLVMLHAMRGVGKTYMALGMAYAVATGGPFLKWKASTPRRVLYVDGEMPAHDMQERFAYMVQGSTAEPPTPDHLRIITPDLQTGNIPDLSTPEGQAAVEEHLDGVSLVVLDNLSTLCRFGRENDAESWEPMQEWLLSLRRRGMSVLLIHHSGKGGLQRGTSKREDALDTVIYLNRPADYRLEEGARFEVLLEKARGLVGDDAKPFEARLEIRDDAAFWTTRDIEDRELELVKHLTADGLSVREIAERTEISRSKVHRLQQRAREEGAANA